MNKDNYFFETFSLVYQQFEAIRLGVFWTPTTSQEPAEAIALNFTNNSSYQESFYQEATAQNQWRLLSNDFCRHLRTCVSHEDLASLCSLSTKTHIYKYNQGQRILFSKD